MYKLNLLNLGIPKSFPSTQIKQINHQDKDLFKGLRDAYWSDDEVRLSFLFCLFTFLINLICFVSRKIEIVPFVWRKWI